MENQNLPQKQPDKASWPQRVKEYFTEMQMEMRRVTWPSWKQVQATTTVVIVSVFAFAAYFMVVDFIVERGVSRVFQTFAR